MINVAQESAAVEQMTFLNTLDVHSLLYPKSQGVMALEAMTYGTTSISTEGVFAKIKERAASLVEKAKAAMIKIGNFIKEKKWWVISGLAVVAAFAATAVVISRKGQAEAAKGGDAAASKGALKSMKSKLEALHKEARERVRVAKAKSKSEKEDARSGDQNAIASAKAHGVDKNNKDLRKLRNREAKRVHADRAARDKASAANRKVAETGKVQGVLGKIMNSIKTLFGMTKSSSSDLARTTDNAKAQPGNEDFISATAWFAKHPIAGAAMFFLTGGIGPVVMSIIWTGGLIQLCAERTKEREAAAA